MLQLCTVYNSFVLPVQCYRVKCRMCTNTLANFVQSYYYTQRKKTKPTKKGEGADSIRAAPSLLFSRCTVFSSRDKVEIERQNKLREADAQATALARSMCEKLLKHNLTAQDDDQLLDDLLQKAGAGNGN